MNKTLPRLLFFAIFYSFLFLLFPQFVLAKVVINEFSSAGSDDWIELYNDGPSPVDLSIYRLRDSSLSNKLDLYGNISPNSFLSFSWSNKLNNDGDTIKLVSVSDENVIIDQITYGKDMTVIAPLDNQSAGRAPDGSSTWVVFTTTTRDQSNNNASILPSPTPTFIPTNTPSPTPTKTPSPTPTVKPTATSVPSSTLIPTRSISYPTPKQNIGTLSTSEGEEIVPTAVLGASTKADKVELQPSPSIIPEVKGVQGNSQTLIQKIFLGIMAVLAIATAGMGIYLYKKS